MFIFKKIKAGALQYVLVVSVLITLIIFAFISLTYLQQRLQIKNSFFKETIQNVQFGFDYLNKVDIPYDITQEKQFSENNIEKTTLLKQHWGIFDLAIITSNIKNESFQKIGLLGNTNPKKEALYLQENNRSLVLVGNTKITGNVALPKQGVKGGNISGTSYYGNQFIYGNQKLSSTTLPKIKNLDFLRNSFYQNFINDSTTFFQLEENLEKIQSFTTPTAVYQTNDNLLLRDCSLRGNIIIQSKTAIKIAPSAILEDIIIIAPSVEILPKVSGNFQVIASKKIQVNEQCQLQYPSALILLCKKPLNINTDDAPTIFIEKKTEIKGAIIFKQEGTENISNFNPQIIISEESIVTGEVYCNQNLELLGSVYGAVYTNNFITKQFGSVYVNHIYNGVINSKKLPAQYCGLQFNSESQNVAKWLY